MSLTICHGPAVEEVARRVWAEDRWCFHCRKRRTMIYVVKMPTESSYWGGYCYIECEVCKTWDADVFPGLSREWEDIYLTCTCAPKPTMTRMESNEQKGHHDNEYSGA